MASAGGDRIDGDMQNRHEDHGGGTDHAVEGEREPERSTEDQRGRTRGKASEGSNDDISEHRINPRLHSR